jgi:hypothetical protein
MGARACAEASGSSPLAFEIGSMDLDGDIVGNQLQVNLEYLKLSRYSASIKRRSSDR